MQNIITILLLLAGVSTFAQSDTTKTKADTTKKAKNRYQLQVSSGPYVDVYDLGIFGKVLDSDLKYSAKAHGRLIKWGKMDRLELKCYFKKSAVSMAFNYVIYEEIYGNHEEPYELWNDVYARNDVSQYIKRVQLSANYYRNFKLSKKSTLQPGIGIMFTREDLVTPYYYLMKNGDLGYSHWNDEHYWEPAAAFNLQYLFRINNTLELGVSAYSSYLFEVGLLDASLQAALAVSLDDLFKKRKKK